MRPLRSLPALAWAALIFTLSSQPRLPDVLPAFDGVDKVVHAAVYGVLALLVLYGMGAPRTRSAYLAALIASLYGITDEVHQMLVPGRSPDVLDWVADTLGALACIATWLALGRLGLRHKRRAA